MKIFSTLIMIFFLTISTAFAAPNLINYQGVLTDSVGVPVNGAVSIEFRLFKGVTGGVPLWAETHTVSVQNGSYNIQLGSVDPFPASLFAFGTPWLEVVASGEVMTPRLQMASVPFALNSETANNVDWVGVTNVPADLADGDDTGITTETDPTVNALSRASLGCASGEVPVFNGTTWACGLAAESDPTVNELAKAGLNCKTGQLVKHNGASWYCADDADTPLGSNIVLTALIIFDVGTNTALFDSRSVLGGDVYTLDGDSFNIVTDGVTAASVTSFDNVFVSHSWSLSKGVSYISSWLQGVRRRVDLTFDGGPSVGTFRIFLNEAFPVATTRKFAPNENDYTETIEFSTDWISIVNASANGTPARTVLMENSYGGAADGSLVVNQISSINENVRAAVYQLAQTGGIIPKRTNSALSPPDNLVLTDLYFDTAFIQYYWPWYQDSFLTGSYPVNDFNLQFGNFVYERCFPRVHKGLVVDNGFIGFKHVEIGCESLRK